jgi:hypothetical protein
VEADLRRTEALVSARLAGDLDHTVSLGGDIPPLGAVVEVERDLVHVQALGRLVLTVVTARDAGKLRPRARFWFSSLSLALSLPLSPSPSTYHTLLDFTLLYYPYTGSGQTLFLIGGGTKPSDKKFLTILRNPLL